MDIASDLGQIRPFSEIHQFSIKLNRREFIAFCNNKLKNKAQMHIEGVKIKQVHKMKFEGVDDKFALNHITSSSFIPVSKSIFVIFKAKYYIRAHFTSYAVY